ncbi:hypothetical protein [Halorubrum sp. Hd13]|uniref:hypothetical protein n=1 Tax=Halorubrum sp. Hd13 TaxID=1480728 RepID=UPI00113FE532|nr:hypothetical protein [Halorubrum sp. Hd13]
MPDSPGRREDENEPPYQQPTGEDNDDPQQYSLIYFIEKNYQLITISGLFAAIAVYLTRLSQELAVEVQYGIAGSLLVFLILMLVIIQDGFETASNALRDGAYLDFGAITVLTVGISALVYSAMTIGAQYGDEITPILDISLFLISISIYSVYLINEFLKYEAKNNVQKIYKISPLIAVGLLYHYFPVGAEVDSMTIGELSYTVIPGIVLHLILTFAVLLSVNLFSDILSDNNRLAKKSQSDKGE